jgi:hypothetical protein
VSDDLTQQLADADARMRGNPLTPEDEARIRACHRRAAREYQIRRDEFDRAQGFPSWPHLLRPAFMVAMLVILTGIGGFLVAVAAGAWR